jgi:hypothetical protein
MHNQTLENLQTIKYLTEKNMFRLTTALDFVDEEVPADIKSIQTTTTSTSAATVSATFTYTSKAGPQLKFKTSDALTQHLAKEYKNNHKLFPKTPQLVEQHGPTCKITAFTGVLTYHYDAKHISKKPLPIVENQDVDEKNAVTALKAAKAAGSEVGRIYNEKMAKKLITTLGQLNKDEDIANAEVIFKRFSQPNVNEQYIQFIKQTLDEGISPPVIFFDVDRENSRSGFPNPNGEGLHEHGAIVVGYCGEGSELSFIIGHWQNYYIVNATELALSAEKIKIGKQPTRYYYQIRDSENGTWFHADNNDDLMTNIHYEIMNMPSALFAPDSLKYKAIATAFKKLQFFQHLASETVTVTDETTNQTLTFTCSITPGTLEPVENDLRSTVCVIVPQSLKKQPPLSFALLETPLKKKQLANIDKQGPILARKRGKVEPWLLLTKPYNFHQKQSAGVEAYCGALSRLIIGIHQPKYRAINHNTVLVKKIESFKPFSQTKHNKDSLSKSNFAAVIVASYYLQEQDLHDDNVGVDDEGNVIRVDFNRSLWQNIESTHPLTADKLLQLPLFNDNLPIAPEQWSASYEIQLLPYDKSFIRNKFKYLLKTALLDKHILQTIALDHLTPKQEFFLNHSERRRQELAYTLIGMEEFHIYFAENYEEYESELKAEFEAYNLEFTIKIKQFKEYLHLIQSKEGLEEIQKNPKYTNSSPAELAKIFAKKLQEYSNRMIDIDKFHQRYQSWINKLNTESPVFVATVQKEKRKKSIIHAQNEAKDTLQTTKAHVDAIKQLIKSNQVFKIGFAGGKQIAPGRTVSTHASLQWSVISDAEQNHINYFDALEDIKGLAQDALEKNNNTRDAKTTTYYQHIIQKHQQSRALLFSHPDLEIEAKRILLKLKHQIHHRKWIVGFWSGSRLNAFEVVPDRVYKQIQIITLALSRESKITCVEALSKVRRLSREALASTSRSRDISTVEYYKKTATLSAFPNRPA